MLTIIYFVINMIIYIKLTIVLIVHPEDGKLVDNKTLPALKDAVRITLAVDPISKVETSVY